MRGEKRKKEGRVPVHQALNRVRKVRKVAEKVTSVLGRPWWFFGGMWTEHDATGASLSVIRDSDSFPVELKVQDEFVEETAEGVTGITVTARIP